MSRISSQGTVIQIQSGASPAGQSLSAGTKAKPCVLTGTALTAAAGDIVVPVGTGFASLDGRPFKVKVGSATSVTLEDSDTTGEAGSFNATDGKLTEPPLVELCRSTFTVNNPAGATIDVTTLCDDAHKIVSGLPAIGTWQANGFYDYSDAAMQVARDYYRDGSINTFVATFRDGSGIAFNATVNLFDLAAGINAAVTNNLGGNIDGLVSMFAPPAAP
jgi:hypothetical protein